MTGSSAFSAAPWLRRIAGSACAREDGSAERAPLTDAPHHDCVEAKAAAIMVSRKDQHHHEQEEIGPGPFAGRTVEAEPKIENLQRADVFNKRMKTPSINDTPVFRHGYRPCRAWIASASARMVNRNTGAKSAATCVAASCERPANDG